MSREKFEQHLGIQWLERFEFIEKASMYIVKDEFRDSAMMLCKQSEINAAWGAWQEQQKQIDELKLEVKKWKVQSIMSVIHGTCDCGEPWQIIVSNKAGFNQLHCFACGKDRHENKDFFGEESALNGDE